MRNQILEFEVHHQSAQTINYRNSHYPPIPVWRSKPSEIDKLKQLYVQNHGTQLQEPVQPQNRWPWVGTPILVVSLLNLGISLSPGAYSFLNHYITTSDPQVVASVPKSAAFPDPAKFPMLQIPDPPVHLLSRLNPTKIRLDALAIVKKPLEQPKAIIPGKSIGKFIVPATGFPITSTFGTRTHPVFGEQRMHSGVDIGTPTGTPIRAADGGQVTFADWAKGYGNMIIISHEDGYETRYAHLDQFYVKPGNLVSQSDVIGLSGSTGYVTGPHLHFEIRLNDVAYDPMNYLFGQAPLDRGVSN